MVVNVSAPLSAHEVKQERQLSERRLGAAMVHRPSYLGLWRVWERRLLGHGGALVKHPVDPERDIEYLLMHATVWHVDPVRGEVHFVEGVAHQCHANAGALWLKGSTPNREHAVTGIGTGYALSGDGLWRQHSWAVTSHEVIVETTEVCVAYAGIVLSGPPARLFAALNTLPT